MKENLDKINPGPFGSLVTNFAGISKKGELSDEMGVDNFLKEDHNAIDGSTMFGEGSIGKIRFAGLAYMMDEEGTIDLSKKCLDVFGDEKFKNFLNKKYPGEGDLTQEYIKSLFSGDAKKATISDLTTHRSGIGDLTKDQFNLFQKYGIEHEFSVPELLSVLPKAERGENGRPKVQTVPPHITMPDSEYGAHQYSNLGYLLLGLAMEHAYDNKKNPDGSKDIKDYKQLTKDYMLNPIEGRANNKGLSFDQTKFPEGLNQSDNIAGTSWIQNDGNLANTAKFSGANAAGGIFASADDSVKFFGEFFKGFPGTPANQKGSNLFFSNDTIYKMMSEAKKHGSCGVKNDNERFQGPGFAFEEDKLSKEPISYEKSGGTFGYQSMLKFDPKSGPEINMIAQENITNAISPNQTEDELSEMMNKYRDKSGNFDRRELIAEKNPALLQNQEILEAVNQTISSLENNGASADGNSTATSLPSKSSTEENVR